MPHRKARRRDSTTPARSPLLTLCPEPAHAVSLTRREGEWIVQAIREQSAVVIQRALRRSRLAAQQAGDAEFVII